MDKASEDISGRRHCTGFKLVDVPELGYTSHDKPHPRGELRLKTKIMISGYYKHPKVSTTFCPWQSMALPDSTT